MPVKTIEQLDNFHPFVALSKQQKETDQHEPMNQLRMKRSRYHLIGIFLLFQILDNEEKNKCLEKLFPNNIPLQEEFVNVHIEWDTLLDSLNQRLDHKNKTFLRAALHPETYDALKNSDGFKHMSDETFKKYFEKSEDSNTLSPGTEIIDLATKITIALFWKEPFVEDIINDKLVYKVNDQCFLLSTDLKSEIIKASDTFWNEDEVEKEINYDTFHITLM